MSDGVQDEVDAQLGGGLGLAYLGGVFTGKNEVIENDQRITKQNLLNSAPSSAPDSAKP